MKGLVLLAALLTISLAGCFGAADPPADAATDTNGALPGLTLSAWTEMRGGRLRMLAVAHNDGPDAYDVRIGCGEPWRSSLIGPTGQEIHYIEVLEEPGCPTYWDTFRPRSDIEALYSWNFRDHDAEAGTSEPVPDGVYEWVLQFTLRDRDEVLETRIPIIVGSGDMGPLAAFEMTLRTGTVPGAQGVNVTVHNAGAKEPAFWTGCMTEWRVRVLDAEGIEVPREPIATCAGFSNTTFPAGHTVYAEFFWDGMTWDGQAAHAAPPGTYRWEITFGLQGTAGDTLVKTASFTV